MKTATFDVFDPPRGTMELDDFSYGLVIEAAVQAGQAELIPTIDTASVGVVMGCLGSFYKRQNKLGDGWKNLEENQ